MNHLSFETLNAFLDQQLAPAARDDAQAHLAACAECRAELAALERVASALASLAPEPMPADLAPRVLAQIEPARPARWIAALIVAETAAAIALAVWLGETLVPLFDLLPDFGAEVLAFQQEVSDALNAITIEPLQEIATTEWLLLGAAAVAVWLLTNWLLLQFPKQKEVFV
jgi:anti-sigma factor RsiW